MATSPMYAPWPHTVPPLPHMSMCTCMRNHPDDHTYPCTCLARVIKGTRSCVVSPLVAQRLCAPMKAHIEARGGSVKVGQPLAAFVLNPASGAIDGLRMANGETLSGFDAYVSALPVDVLKRLVPLEWSTMPYFRQLDQLEGIPVINLQMWFDTKLRSADGLCFSRSPLLSVCVYTQITPTIAHRALHRLTRSILG